MSGYKSSSTGSSRTVHPSAMRYSTTTTTPHLSPVEHITNLLSLTRTKLSLLYSSSTDSAASSPNDVPESDFLRRSVLLQNIFERGFREKEKEVERERREREARYRESVLVRSARERVGRGGWKGQAFEVGMDALFEDEEEDEEDEHIERVGEREQGMSVKIVDPTFGSTTVEGEEEAWFEQTWNELQDDSTIPGSVDVDVQVYPVEDDDSIYSATTSSSSRSTSPSSIDALDRDLDHELSFERVAAAGPRPSSSLSLSPPRTPKLRPTKVDDKLDGPMEWGTEAAALECGVSVEWIMERWEVLDEDEEELEDEIELMDVDEVVSSQTRGGNVTTTAPALGTATYADTDTDTAEMDDEEADESDVYSDMDVPDLDSDADEDDLVIRSNSNSRSRTTDSAHLLRSSSSSSSSSFVDDPLLVTPTEDALDDFDHDDEPDGQDYDEEVGVDGEARAMEVKVPMAVLGKKEGGGGAGGLFARPIKGGVVRVV